jgi:hypothetical protein
MLMQEIVPSGLVIIVIAWCIRMRGPLFAAVFNPLQLLLVAIFAYLLVDEKLYLGRYVINLTYPKTYIIHMYILFICIILLDIV